jgi:hypothetical protein
VYHSDFFMHNIFEVKSCYTYDKNGKNINDRINNNLKWKAALEQGYGLVIVWDKKYLMELTLDDFDEIDRNLYILNKCVNFNEKEIKKMILRWANENNGKLNIDLSRVKKVSQKLNNCKVIIENI